MPLFSSPTSPGRGLARFGAGVPEFVEFLVIAGGGGFGHSSGPFYYERYKPWREEFYPTYCQPHYLGAVTGSIGGAGGYISSVVGEKSGRNTSPVAVLTPSPGTPYSITVGSAGSTGSNSNGSKGGNTSAFGHTAIGGGGGGRACCTGGSNGSSGGCGGGGGGSFPHLDGPGPCGACQGASNCGSGAPGSGTANQGFPGVSGTAQGGGAGSATGAGIISNITGSSLEYSKGGAAPAGSTYGCPTRPGAVILRYQGVDPTVSAGLSYSVSTVGTNQVMVITAGTGTITW